MSWKRLMLDGDTAAGPVLQGIVSVNPPNIARGSTSNVDVSINGLLTGHRVYVQCQANLENGLVCVAAYCPVNGILRLRIANWSNSAVNGASRNWAYQAFL